MKTKLCYFSLLLFIMIPMSAFSATVADILKDQATLLQTYLAEREKLIISDIYSVGELKEQGMVFEAIIAHEPATSNKVGGIQVYTREPQERQYYFTYVDADEVGGLLKAIMSMIDLHNKKDAVASMKRRNITYTCKGGFMVQVEQEESKERIYIGGRTLTIMLEKSSLISLREILEKAQEVLINNNVLK